MPNFNINPYFDDFSPEKDYHKILFKPGYSVQARELTQIQSILQNQLKTFGGHVFKHGSIVIPGNTNADLYVPYIKLLGVGSINVTTLIGAIGVGQTSGVTFVIKNAVGAIDTDPDTLYVGYISGSGKVVDGETILIGALSLTVATTNGTDIATGLSASAYVNPGVYYVNGYFANVAKQTVIVSKYTNTPTAHVLLKIVENIVTSDTDQTLLDPANGSYNYSAPGADRFKLSLILTTLPAANPIGSNITADYIELMRFNGGAIEEHSRFPKYNELEKSLARRTADESGDYIVRGLKVSAREHLKTKFNTGQFTSTRGGNADKFVINVEPGKAYIQGFENELLAKTAFAVDKARTANHIKTRALNVTPAFGQYLYVSDLLSLPNIVTRETVQLFSFAAGTQVGTAKIIAVDYHDGNDTTQSAISRFFITDIAMTAGNALTGVGYIKSSTGVAICKVLQKLSIPGSGVTYIRTNAISVTGVSRSAIVWKWDKSLGDLYVYRDSTNAVPITNDLIVGTNGSAVVAGVVSVGNFEGNSSVIQLPVAALFSAGASGVSYKVYKYITGTTGTNTATLSIATISGITIDPLEVGNIIAVGPNGILSTGNSTLNTAGTDITLTGTWVSGLPISAIVAVSKIGTTSKTKNLIQNTQQSGLIPSQTVLLNQSDIYTLQSVVSSTMGNVTDRYKLDNGQRDYAYLRGRLILVGALPTGTLTVVYDYFSHTGTGDFFGPESYAAALANRLDLIPNFKSPTDGKIYSLASSVDFRPRENITGTGYDSLSDMLIPQSRFSSTIQYYVPQIAVTTIDRSSKIQMIYGTPAELPVEPSIPVDQLPLALLYIPAYTSRVEDIRISIPNNQGYTMAEIGKLESRVMNIESFTLLTQSEKSTINFNVIDAATGLSRFKSGYLVDTFDNPDTISDLGNLEFSVTYTGGAIIPQIERQLIDMSIKTTNSLTLSPSGMVYSLPYTETTFAKQPLSSRQTNLNPFLSFGWTGHMKMSPSFDNWIETEYLPMQINNLQTQTVTVHRPFGWIPTPAGALVQFTPAPPPIINRITHTVFHDVQARRFGGGGKIICTAMNEMYGLPYRENKIWLQYSNTHLTAYHQIGYHKVFLPLVDYGFNSGNGWSNLIMRDILIWIGKNRTADIQNELLGKKRNNFHRMLRAIIEPTLAALGKFLK